MNVIGRSYLNQDQNAICGSGWPIEGRVYLRDYNFHTSAALSPNEFKDKQGLEHN
jgi:hypothetical protein